MATTTKNQWSITKYQQDTHLLTWIEAFLVDRKVQGLSKGTLYFYQKKLKLFADFCEAQVITQISQITPNLLRAYMQGLVPRSLAVVRTVQFRPVSSEAG